MRYLRILIFFVILFLFSTSNAHAIIFLPALILIPIAKIVAVVIGGLSLPAFGFGAAYHYLFGKSLKRTVVVILTMILVLAAIVFFILKLENPQRPIF